MAQLLAQINTNRRFQSILLIAAAVVSAVLAGLAIAREMNVVLLGLAASGLVTVVFINPRLGIAFAILILLFQDWLVYGLQLLPSQFTWLSDGLLVALWLSTMLRRLQHSLPLVKTPIDYLVLALVLVGILSAIGNSLIFMEVVFGFRIYFRFFFLFYTIVYLDLEEAALRRMVMVFVFAAALSIPITFVNYSIWGPNDFTGGGIGLKSAQSLLFNATMIFLLSAWMIRQGLRIRWVFIVVGLMLPWVLGSVVAAFFYFPVTLLFISRRLISSRYLVIAPLLAATYAAGVIIYPKILPANALQRFLFSPSAILEELQGPNVYRGEYGEAGLRRLPALRFSHNLVQSDPLAFLVGFGPGVFSPVRSSVSSYGNLYQQYEKENFTRTQFAQTISELGYLGLGLMFLIVLRLFWVNDRLLRNKGDPFWYGVFVAFEAALFLFVILSLYQSTWTLTVSGVLFWTLAALASKKWLEGQANKAVA